MTRNIIAKELGTDLMLYDTEQDEVHILNGTARVIYELRREGKSIEEIADTIRSTFRLEPSVSLERDIGESIDELKRKGLIASHE